MNTTVLAWLDQTARLYADKPIMIDGDERLTFGEFDRLSRSVGTFLAGHVPFQSPVVVIGGRHPLTPAVFLGVVRAGCFYAPMDATMPKARLNQMLKVIGAGCMLVDRAFADVAEALDFDGERFIMMK